MKKLGQDKNFLVVKHNSLVEFTSKHSYSLNQLKLISHLIAHIKPSDIDFELKRVSLEELGITRENGLNHTFLKVDLENIFDKKIKLSNGFLVHWFSAFKYENGIIDYRFDPLLKPYLLDLKENFTTYKLNNILSLQSTFSIKLYELLIQYATLKKREIEIEELREYLNLPDSYKNGNILQLLNKSQKELEEKTNLSFTYVVKKLCRRIHKVIFIIQETKQAIKPAAKNTSLRSSLKTMRVSDNDQ